MQFACGKNAMEIAEIHIYSHQLHVIGGPFRIASSEVDCLDTTLVKCVSETGLIGWGETCPVGPTYQPHHAAGARAALATISPALIGASALQPVILRRRMDAALDGHRYAKAAIDIAIHDLMGKHYGARVADLLGGAVTERVPSYYSLGVGDPDEIACIAAEKATEGYPRLQIKIGNRPIETDIETVRKVWERLDRKPRLAVDGNRSLSTGDCLRLSRECPDIPFILEQPCNRLEEITAILPRLQHGVYLDENGVDLAIVVHAAGQGLCDGFAMKLTRIGGLQQMAAFRDICEARSMPHSCDDAWGGDIIAAACTHIGATVLPRLNEGAWIAAPYIETHYDAENGISIQDGHIALPKGPGLGITPNEVLFGDPVMSFGGGK